MISVPHVFMSESGMEQFNIKSLDNEGSIKTVHMSSPTAHHCLYTYMGDVTSGTKLQTHPDHCLSMLHNPLTCFKL